MNQSNLLNLYRVMLTARQVDKAEQDLTKRGEAFFHVSCSGHEALAALAQHLTPDDYLHCHYRDKALLLARGVPIRAFFDNLFCKDGSSSRGRQMSAFFSDRALKVVTMVSPTGNNTLQSAGLAAAIKDRAGNPIVMCTLGDGTTQQGEFLEAVGEAVRRQSPVLFLIQDNRFAISTTTAGKTFYSLPGGPAREFLGVEIQHVDGVDPVATLRDLGAIVGDMRQRRGPRLVVMHVERLANHTNADDQRVYRSDEEIHEVNRTSDPITHLERSLLADGVTAAELASIRAEVEQAVHVAEEESALGPEPAPTFVASPPLKVELSHPSYEVRGEADGDPLNMGQAIREVLRQRLSNDSRVFLFGEDIEDPKGDVFGLTRGLSTTFQGRVLNSPLSESTIVGACIGRALAGQHPVAFLQFADFLPLAYNQLVSELANIHWRCDGQWRVPMIVLVASGGYRPGLGPFHAQTFDSVMTHVPGLDVFAPSTATDAAGMLNAAFHSERPTILFYPKALLNDPSRATTPDVDKQFIPIGTARKTRVGRDLTLVGWGNTVSICERAAQALEKHGVDAEVIDLRCLAPWDEKMVVASAEKTSRLIVVHEDSHTCGFGGEVLATVAEKSRFPVAMRRVTRPDTYIPCNFANQLEVLPSYQRVLATAADLLDFDLTWRRPAEPEEGVFELQAIGSAPSDETVLIVELMVKPGDRVERGDAVASVEAAKSVFEITATVAGEVLEVMGGEGETIAVGKTLMKLRVEQPVARRKAVVLDDPGEPVLTRRRVTERLPLPRREAKRRAFDVGMSAIEAITGGRMVSNQELLEASTSMTSADIVRLTGIESRNWVTNKENAVSLAVRASLQALEREGLSVDELNLVICSTTSPTSVTPSMACRVLNGLVRGRTGTTLQAFDINAACSGYLYALQAGYDYLQSMPDGRVLVVTTEVLSPLLNREDLDTAILFGDAASATVLYGESYFEQSKGRLFRPELSAKGEDGSSLTVPFRDSGFIQMRGRRVFTEAVRSMITSLNRVCQREGVGVDDLKMIVPHQANQRILDAIQSRVGPAVYSNIRRFGNTSSTSIPLCLSEVMPQASAGDRYGLCAFGGGFTFGASILQSL